MAKPHLYIILFLIGTVFFSCQNNERPSHTEGATRIIADESFAPVVDAEHYIFKNSYPRAKVEIIYKPEKELLNQFLNKEVRVAILSRKLNPEEAKVYENINVKIRTTRFAVDAIALIAHKSQNDTSINVQDIIEIMKGNKSLNSLVFDNANSSTVRYLMDLADVKLLPKEGVYALKSNPEVIKYVHNNPGSIGVIGVNWVKQPGDDLEQYLKEMKVLSVKNLPGKPGDDKYYKPNQDNLAMGVYPLSRDLFIIDCEGGPGVGAGFASFIAGEIGQRIVLKSGLLPDSIPPREILIRK
jgi:phosphate transport system substrate-binding protein